MRSSCPPGLPGPRLLLLVDTWRTLARAGDRRAPATDLIPIGCSAAWLDGLAGAELAEPPRRIFRRTYPPGADAQLELLTRVDVTADLAGITIPALVVAGAHDQVISRHSPTNSHTESREPKRWCWTRATRWPRNAPRNGPTRHRIPVPGRPQSSAGANILGLNTAAPQGISRTVRRHRPAPGSPGREPRSPPGTGRRAPSPPHH